MPHVRQETCYNSATYKNLSLVTKRNGVKNLFKGNYDYRTLMFMKKKSGNG